jgi:CRP/FNR family transcriptional regulator, cyclic AMP receptor protein
MSRLEKKSLKFPPNFEGIKAVKQSSVYPTLQRCTLFDELDETVLSELTALSSFTREGRRQLIYAQGGRATELFVISRGRVRVYRDAGKDRLFTIAYRGAGELIGESALGRASVFHDTAVASDQVELIRVPLANIENLIETNNRFARKLLRLIVDRCLEMERRLERLFVKTIESRIAEFLLEAATQHGIPESRGIMIGAKYTHQEIADYVGSTRETVTLVLGQLKRRGFVLPDHRQLVVRNEKALEKLADVRK